MYIIFRVLKIYVVYIMIIAFHTPSICVRGTSVALYDYAHHAETLLGHTAIILVPKTAWKSSDPIGIVRMVQRFLVVFYDDLETALRQHNCDLLYCIKYGHNDGVVSRRVKTVVHCVFDMSQPHGDVYAGVSADIAAKFGSTLFVPHMIALPPSITKDNWRGKLGIPSNAIVFGRYGGMDTFNLPFAPAVISRVVDRRPDIYFVFINTPLITHQRIIYLDKIVTEDDKNKFINTCDAYLECGTMGHSFGLAIGEFSVNNKAIIAYNGPELWNRAHISILKNNGLYFTTENELEQLLLTFRPGNYPNCYVDYSPEKVMTKFNRVFVESL